MRTTLLRPLLSAFFYLSITCALQCVPVGTLHAQSSNLLLNGSFEAPAMANTNSNNIMGAGNSWGYWDCSNGGINIIRVQGSGYASGANQAAEGSQYLDVANSDGFIYQSFVLTHATPIVFHGDFSNREPGWSSFVNWTGRIDILDAGGLVVATSTTRDFITTDDKEPWYTLMGSTSTLPAGTYTYRAYAGNSGHFDNAVVSDLGESILGVKLTQFTATLKDGQVNLAWNVAEEKGMKGYEWQYSTNGIQFEKGGFIPAGGKEAYKAVHNAPSSGYNYYRLSMQDVDGKITYSAICQVNLRLTVTANIFPNPAYGSFNIMFPEEMKGMAGSMSIVSPGGRVVQSKKFTTLSRTEAIDISRLSPGVYFVAVNVSGGAFNKILNVMGR
jgi:Secretion system C-terminal sorting domain